MITQTVILKVEKSVNHANEIQPNLYTVIVDGEVLFATTDPLCALQAVLNRS